MPKITLLTLWATAERIVQPGDTVEVDKETYDLLVSKGYGHEADVDVSSPDIDESDEVEYPAGNASTEAWAEFAVEHHGADPTAIADMSRDDLRAEFGPDADES